MNESEFSQILRLYGDMAYRMACHLTQGNQPLARDLVQDAFIKIWKNWDWQRPQSFKGWMYRILHNLYVDYLRKRTRESSVSYDAPNISEEQDFQNTLVDGSPLELDRLEGDEMKNVVHRALERLPEDYRLPILLCDMEGLPYVEIARILSCPVGTVRSRIHRGRRELRRALRPCIEGSKGVAAATPLVQFKSQEKGVPS